MSFSDAFSYFVALFVIAVAPGPTVLVLMARSAAGDQRGAAGFGLGFSLGGVAIVTAMWFGLSAWHGFLPEVFTYAKFALTAYILWWAHRIWQGNFDMRLSGRPRRAAFCTSIGAGFTASFVSPYMIFLFPVLLPQIVSMARILMPEFLILAALTFAARATGTGFIILFAARMTRLVQSRQSIAIMNRSLASLLVAGGGLMVFT